MDDSQRGFDRGTFGLLPEPTGRAHSFALSTVLNATVAAIVLVLSLAQVHVVRQPEVITRLVLPTQPKPIPPLMPKVRELPPSPVVRSAIPKIAMHHPVTPPPPKPIEIKMPEPSLPKLETAPPRRVAPPPQPKVGLFRSEAPTLVANNMARPSVQAGGFGDPQGAKVDPNANRPATIAAVGSFSRAPGIGPVGTGRAHAGSIHGTDFGSGVAHGAPGGCERGTVASAGFSTGVVGGAGAPRSHGTVARVSFANNQFDNPAAARLEPVEPVSTPVVVLSKPLPSYTSEARELKIQGDVTLRVRFTASGQAEVLGVVDGLGHGLDERAVKAAERIRFKPATRDGHPIDQISLVRITFQLG